MTSPGKPAANLSALDPHPRDDFWPVFQRDGAARMCAGPATKANANARLRIAWMTCVGDLSRRCGWGQAKGASGPFFRIVPQKLVLRYNE